MSFRIYGLVLAAFSVAALAGPGAAQTSPPAATNAATAKAASVPKHMLGKVTCAEFNGLDETFRPQVIAWAAGYQQGRKQPDAVAVDIAGIEKITPFVVEECKKSPTTSRWEKVEGELKKIF